MSDQISVPMIPGTSAQEATFFFGDLVIRAWAAMLEHENRKKPEDVANDAIAYASALAPKLLNLHFNARQHDERQRAASEPAPPPELDEHPEIQDAPASATGPTLPAGS